MVPAPGFKVGDVPRPQSARERRRELAQLAADAENPPNSRPNEEPTYHCVYCHVRKAGRFTRHKHASGMGWQQGHTLPIWACYDCLPLGQGRNE